MAVAIKITQEIKDKNERYNIPFVENNAVGKIVKTSFPNKFYVTEPVSGGYATRTDLHEADGFKEIIVPSYNSETQKLGNVVIEVNNNFTYEVINLTQQEIEDRIISQAQSSRDAKLQQATIEQAAQTFQNLEDVETVLANSEAYPLWRDFEDSYSFPLNFKVQDFNAENELKVYKVIQPHNKQSDWIPRIVPALFVLVQPEGATEWEAGASYQIGDIRTYNGVEYECLQPHTAIVGWEPPNVPALWKIYNP